MTIDDAFGWFLLAMFFGFFIFNKYIEIRKEEEKEQEERKNRRRVPGHLVHQILFGAIDFKGLDEEEREGHRIPADIQAKLIAHYTNLGFDASDWRIGEDTVVLAKKE